MLALLQATPTALLAFLRQAVRVAPTTAKYIAILLLVLNVNSFPLVWHGASFPLFFRGRKP
jgi:hypothetical protein